MQSSNSAIGANPTPQWASERVAGNSTEQLRDLLPYIYKGGQDGRRSETTSTISHMLSPDGGAIGNAVLEQSVVPN